VPLARLRVLFESVRGDTAVEACQTLQPSQLTPAGEICHQRFGAPRRRRAIRHAAYALSILFDGVAVVCAYGLGLLFRFGGRVPETYALRFVAVSSVLAVIYVTANVLLRMYWRGWRFASVQDALALSQAVGIATCVAIVADMAIFPLDHPLPVSIFPAGGVFALAGMGLGRFRYRLLQYAAVALNKAPAHRVLIVGAGTAGEWLARELQLNPKLGFLAIGFVDDDRDKQGQRIQGLRIIGTRHEVRSLVQHHRVDTIVVAIPSLTPEQRRAILAHCEDTPAQIKIVPGLPELLDRRQDDTLFRDARIEDLLGRPPVLFGDRASVRQVVQGSVLITGAAGSIGSELARQLAANGARQLVLLDSNESELFDLVAQLQLVYSRQFTQLETVVADVRHEPALQRAFHQYRPTTVFHAAAYKHVPLMQAHPQEAVITNVVGTYNVCRAAATVGCSRFVFISTDKAVAPVNVMGATKRIGELMVQAFAGGSTIFCAVRFGNVLGSRGSVIPTFARQIRDGGPVTITHPDMTRFFMSIPEAANLIIEASCHALGGDIFILDMGSPVRVLDLAHKLIRLHGLRPGTDIEIREIGMRPGEKLHEALTTADETVLPTPHPRVLRVREAASCVPRREEIQCLVDRLRILAETAPTEALVDAVFTAVTANGREAAWHNAWGPRALGAAPIQVGAVAAAE
jgi:FlaA1/EpsC-like NDP-sugar epimerase